MVLIALTACGEATVDNGQEGNGEEEVVCDIMVGEECYELVDSKTSENGRFPAPSYEIEGASAFYIEADLEVSIYYDVYTCGGYAMFDSECEGTYFPETPRYESESSFEHRLTVEDPDEVYFTFWISNSDEVYSLSENTTWSIYRLLELQ